MVFCMPQKKVVIPRLKIANTEIDSVDRFNFLGVLLEKHLSWDAHTNALVGKISRTTGILNKLKLFLPQYILKTIYTSLILCQLNYGILAWGHIVGQPNAIFPPNPKISGIVFFLLIIHPWGVYNEIWGGVEVSPLSNFKYSRWRPRWLTPI